MTRQGVNLIEVGRFAVTGAAAYAVDVVIFNLLSDGTGHLTAKVISSIAAITVAWLGSRYYTWPDHRPTTGHPIAVFVTVSAAAAVLQLGCLWLSHDLIGWRSAIADNLSANVVGMGMATALRFWGFKRFVFPSPTLECEPLGAHPMGAGAQ